MTTEPTAIDKMLNPIYYFEGGEDPKANHLRISSQSVVYTNLVKEYFKKYFMVAECADDEVERDHTHSHLEQPTVQLTTFRNKLTKIGNKGNKFYSCSAVKDRHKNLCYLCKGKSKDEMPIVLLNNLLTEIEIKLFHCEYWITNEKLKKKSKDKTLTFVQCCVEEARKDPELCSGPIRRRQKERMFRLVCAMLGDRFKVLDVIVLRRLCNGVFNITNPFGFRTETLYEQVYPPDEDF